LQVISFNPRLPCGRRLAGRPINPPFIYAIVSIHASHAGGDDFDDSILRPLRCFNPRLPCGRRLGGT